jgi:hypothetical protein
MAGVEFWNSGEETTTVAVDVLLAGLPVPLAAGGG